ncbi:hypothetical protein [Neisseria shayeganii]|nr:hypothetical protein [Neisseria shayeganii]
MKWLIEGEAPIEKLKRGRVSGFVWQVFRLPESLGRLRWGG